MNLTENGLAKTIDFFKSFGNVSPGDIVGKLEQYEEYRLGLLSRAPFHVGDTVELIADPVINEKTAPGWIGFKHFLIKDARAEVRSIDFRKGRFVFGLWFEKDSWLKESEYCHTKNKIVVFDKPEVVLTKDRGEFGFWEGDLRLVQKNQAVKQEPVKEPERKVDIGLVKSKIDGYYRELCDLWQK